MKPNKAKEAITKIAEGNSIMAQIAEDALYDEQGTLDFCKMILDQFNDGCGGSMAVLHGFEEVNAIISYAKWYANYQENYQVQFSQGFDPNND